MPAPLRSEKVNALVGTAFGVLLVILGSRTPGPARILMVLAGCWLAVRSSQRFAWLATREDRAARDFGKTLREDLRRASLPRQLFGLLYAVAEVDGKAGEAERELVRRFLSERFTDPLSQADLREYETARIPPEQVLALAYDLRRALSSQERTTVFFWCCLVALADGRFAREEHAALQGITQGLGIPPQQARRIFLHAKARTLGQETGAGDPGKDPGARRRTGARGVVTDRAQALAILGLPSDATQDQIRRQHRKLVKEHHPDAHAHLGPVAAQEATERFREIQAAYEELTR